MSGPIRLPVFISTTIAATLLVSCGVAMAGTFPVVICGSSPRDPADGLIWSANAPLVATAQCPYNGPGLELYSPANKTVGKNATAAFKVTSPGGIAVYSIHVVNAYSSGIGTGGWWGEFYWNGGPGPAGRSGPLSDAQFNNGGCCSQTNLQSQTIGWFIACNQSSCSSGAAGRVRGMAELDLVGEEAQAPTIIASGGDNLWYQGGWVRGLWPVSFTASDPSGVCGAAVVFGSLPAILTPTPDTAPNRHTWQQCPQQSVPAAVDTSASDGSLGRGEGAMQLRLTATNTAGVTANPTKTVYVDDSTPTVSLSGPTDAPSTAGTQYVTATASAGPAGVAGLSCSLNGAPAQWYPGSSARVAVQNLGPNSVTCSAANKARDVAGNPAWSAPASWTLSIREPTTAALSFGSRIRDALQCRRVKERVRVPAKWVTVRRHGKRVKVKRRAHTKVVKVTRCHARMVRVRVRVKIKGHWRWRWERQARLPHTIQLSSWRARHGATAKVVGWLGTTGGVALAGQNVRILTAPNNGLNAFTQAAVAITGQNGVWHATLRAGPSRLVQAIYDGGSTVEPATSGQVRLIVPALVKLRIRPRRTHWWRSPRSPGTIRITGRVLGGYIPGVDQQLLRLRIGVVGIPGVQSTIGIPGIAPDGRFHTTWTPAPGNGTVRFWFSVSTLHEADFPFAPSSSRRVDVIVR